MVTICVSRLVNVPTGVNMVSVRVVWRAKPLLPRMCALWNKKKRKEKKAEHAYITEHKGF